MKNFTILSAFLCLSIHTRAQQIDNHGFDSVFFGGINRIHQWITSDAWPVWSVDTVFPLNPNDHYISPGLQYHEVLRTVQIEDTGAFNGPYAIKVLTDSGLVKLDGSAYRGFITNGDHFYTGNDGYIDLKKGGTPFAFRPSKLKGHYKFVDNSPSLSIFPKAIVLLKKYNVTTQQSDTVGFAVSAMQLSPTAIWSPFELQINYYNSSTPDTLMIAFMAPDIEWSSTLWLDSLGFEYLPTGISGPEKEAAFSVFPNPVKDVLHLFLETQFVLQENKIQLFNVLGKEIYSSSCNQQRSDIDLRNLNGGIYFIQLKTHSGIFSKKIILLD